MEDDVADLAGVTAFSGQFDGAGHAAVAVVASDPALEFALDLVGGLLGCGRGAVRGVMGQARQVPGRERRRRAQLTDQFKAARGEAADEGDEQQDVDGGEPPATEHVEQLEAVVELAQPAVFGDVLVDVAFVETALRQERARDGGDGQQEQQDQRRAHGGEGAPCVAEERGGGSGSGHGVHLRVAARRGCSAPVESRLVGRT